MPLRTSVFETDLYASSNTSARYRRELLHRFLGVLDERLKEVHEFHREYIFCRRALPDTLQRLKILKRECLRIDVLGDREYLIQRQRKALSPKYCRLPVTFSLQYRGLLFALGYRNSRGLGTFCLGYDRAAGPFSGHLPDHGVRYVLWRHDLAYLDRRYLDAPALCDIVKFLAEDLVYLFAF